MVEGFDKLSFIKLKGSDDKEVNRRVYNINRYKYNGPQDHLALN